MLLASASGLVSCLSVKGLSFCVFVCVCVSLSLSCSAAAAAVRGPADLSLRGLLTFSVSVTRRRGHSRQRERRTLLCGVRQTTLFKKPDGDPLFLGGRLVSRA